VPFWTSPLRLSFSLLPEIIYLVEKLQLLYACSKTKNSNTSNILHGWTMRPSASIQSVLRAPLGTRGMNQYQTIRQRDSTRKLVPRVSTMSLLRRPRRTPANLADSVEHPTGTQARPRRGSSPEYVVYNTVQLLRSSLCTPST
jgi:hypothetical protein